MPADVTQAKNFLVHSDYPVDKIAYKVSGSFTLSASTTGQIHSVAHGLDFTPLTSGNWSLNSDFSTAYEFSVGTFPSGNPGYLFQRTCNVFAGDTNIYISADNLSTQTTLYYRVFCFAPPGETSSVNYVQYSSDNYVFNTDYNLPKLYKFEAVTLPATPSAPYNYSVEHALGYTPQVMGWVHYDTYDGTSTIDAVHPVGTSNGAASPNIPLSVNDNYATFNIPQFSSEHTAYVRIYIDE